MINDFLSYAIIDKLQQIVIEAGAIARYYFGSSKLLVKWKKDHSPVTNSEIEINELLCKELNNLFPEFSLISEEHENSAPGEIFWLVDPVDGTRNYIRADLNYTINVGLIKNSTPIFGIIYKPEIDLLYYTNEKGLLVIKSYGKILKKYESDLPLIRILIKNKNHFNNVLAPMLPKYIRMEQSYYAQYFSGSSKFAYIAHGFGDVYLCNKSMEWDTAAGHALLRSVGGDIRSLTGEILQYGKPNFLNGEVIAYNNRIKKFSIQNKQIVI